MKREHTYTATLTWNSATPTTDYKSYEREFTAAIDGRPDLIGSADPTYLGDASRHNPEDLLLVSVAACHMLSYLAVASFAGLVVVGYEDEAVATMKIHEKKMRITEVVLHPHIRLATGSDLALAETLHHKAHDGCFIANSVNFPVTWQPIHSA
jgi:organic hydroperoxide reductase OsmC/OhrA